MDGPQLPFPILPELLGAEREREIMGGREISSEAEPRKKGEAGGRCFKDMTESMPVLMVLC